MSTSLFRSGRGWRPKASIAGLGIVGCSALLLSGCLTTEADLTVKGDGSGELVIEALPPVEITPAIEQAGVQSQVRRAIEDIDGAEFSTDKRLGTTVYVLRLPFEDYADLTTDVADGASVEGQLLAPFSKFDLEELPDGGWALDAVTNPLSAAATFSADDRGQVLAAFQQLAATDEAGAGLDLSITLPGQLTDSNATEQDGNTATWSIDDPLVPYVLQMRSEPDPLLTTTQILWMALAAIFVVGAALMFVGATGPPKRKARNNSKGDGPKSARARSRKSSATIAAGSRPSWEDSGVRSPSSSSPTASTGPVTQHQLPPLGTTGDAGSHPDAP